MTNIIDSIEFELLNDVSKKGTPLKYIQFTDDTLRLSENQKETLEAICQGYFFYSKSKKMWGFTQRGNNEVHVYNFLKSGIIPDDFKKNEITRNVDTRKEAIPFNVKDFDLTFIELKGRPLFYYENKDGTIEININLAHWFFENKDSSEKEIAKKIILSLVGTELEFTSQLIDSYFIKLNSIQENLKYTYDRR